MSKQTTPTPNKTTIMTKYLSSLQKSKRLRAPEKKIVVPRLFCVENDIDFLIMISNYKFTRQKKWLIKPPSFTKHQIGVHSNPEDAKQYTKTIKIVKNKTYKLETLK